MCQETDKLIVTSIDQVMGVVNLFESLPSPDPVEEIQKQVDRVREPMNALIPNLPNISFTNFGMIGISAINLIHDEGQFKKKDFCQLLMIKHKRYGAKPLRAWGAVGVIIRIHSKFERYLNLREQPSLKTKDESLMDTLNDILGYAVLGYLMVK